MPQPISFVRVDLFWSKVDRSAGADACWPWTSTRDRDGYGQHSRRHVDGRSTWQAHRVAYELLIGPIPEGLQIDHLCRDRACVNPAHLEPVTAEENSRRSNSWRPAPRPPRRSPRLASVCRNGHPYVDGSYFIYQGWRRCKQCISDRLRQRSGAVLDPAEIVAPRPRRRPIPAASRVEQSGSSTGS